MTHVTHLTRDLRVMLGTHYPCSQAALAKALHDSAFCQHSSTGYQHGPFGPLTKALFTGVQNDTRVHGPCYAGRVHGP